MMHGNRRIHCVDMRAPRSYTRVPFDFYLLHVIAIRFFFSLSFRPVEMSSEGIDVDGIKISYPIAITLRKFLLMGIE